MPNQSSPIRPTDQEARALAADLLAGANYAALAVIDPQSKGPFASRIAFARLLPTQCVTLISDLSFHTKALRANPKCSLLIGAPGDKGDPLTHPRLTLQCTANFITRKHEQFTQMRAQYLDCQPKAKLYIDFADFNFVRFEIHTGHLNGGFGKAFVLNPSDFTSMNKPT